MADLNPNAQKWVDALESDQFKQGKFRLTTLTDDGPLHCCLGVACQVAIANGVDVAVEDGYEEVYCGMVKRRSCLKYDGETSSLPSSVRNWLAITTSQGRLPGTAESLSKLNDSDSSFAEIAATIRERADELFHDHE